MDAPLNIGRLILCECGRLAEAGRSYCRLCYEDGWRRTLRNDFSFESPRVVDMGPRPPLTPKQLKECQ